MDRPVHIDLEKTRGLTIEWADGSRSFLPVDLLRRMSPSAEARELRQQLEKNPLTVLPSSKSAGPLTAESAELIGNYALRIRFSDGHDTGLYTWQYLRELDDQQQSSGSARSSKGKLR